MTSAGTTEGRGRAALADEPVIAAVAPVDQTHLRILSYIEWVEPVAMFLKRQAQLSGLCDQNRADRLVIALTEALNNGIVHGNLALDSALKEDGGARFRQAIAARAKDPGYVNRILDIQVERDVDSCTWVITDEGDGFDVDRVVARQESEDPQIALSSGRGMAIMRGFVDEVAWAEQGRQVRLTLYTEARRDRCGSPCYQYTATVMIHGGQGEGDRAMACHLSRHGIAMVTVRRLKAGQPVTVVLDAELESARPVPGRIVRCRHVAGVYHDVAVNFDEPIPLPEA